MLYIPFQRGSIAPKDRPNAEANLAARRTELVAATDAPTRMQLLGQIGETLYLLGDPVTAIPLLREAVTIAQGTDDARQQAAQRLRLATALQYANEHAAAEIEFRRGLSELAPTAEGYRDFYLQHLGKCLAEMERIPEAVAHFSEALLLRQTKGAASLIASTEKALYEASEMLKASP